MEQEPRIYLADLAAYNEGKLIGDWLDLTDYDDADELMDAISDKLEEWSEEQGVEREEYAIDDFENLPATEYSRYMGKESFETIYELINVARDNNVELEIVNNWVENTNDDPSSFSDAFISYFDSKEDYARHLVEEGVMTPDSDHMFVTDTDKRIVASEQRDHVISDPESFIDPEYEDGELTEDSEEELENIADAEYKRWYDGLEDDPVYFLTEEEGIYSEEDLKNVSFLNVDYERMVRDLEMDHTFIESDDKVYVFSDVYAKGGDISSDDDEYVNYGFVLEGKYQDGSDFFEKLSNRIELNESIAEINEAQTISDEFDVSSFKAYEVFETPSGKEKEVEVDISLKFLNPRSEAFAENDRFKAVKRGSVLDIYSKADNLKFLYSINDVDEESLATLFPDRIHKSLQVGDVYNGRLVSTYEDSSELYKPYTSYVLDNKTNQVLSIHETPIDAIKKRNELDVNYNVHFDKSEAYNKGGSTGLPSVEVIFENPKHNYVTNMAKNVTREDAMNYFIGKKFNVGVFPNENLQKVIDIEYSDSENDEFEDVILKSNPNHKYSHGIQKTLSRWSKNGLTYKVALALLRGDKNIDDLYDIEPVQYSRILRKIDTTLPSSQHEVAWRSGSYNLRQAEEWARSSARDYFVLDY